MEISTSRKTLKRRIFQLQFILALILDTGKTNIVCICFKQLCQGYQNLKWSNDESDSDQSNFKNCPAGGD